MKRLKTNLLKSKEGKAHACEFDATKRRKLDASAVKKDSGENQGSD